MQTWFQRITLGALMVLSLSSSIQAAEPPKPSALVGKPVDIAFSAYQYRSDPKTPSTGSWHLSDGDVEAIRTTQTAGTP